MLAYLIKKLKIYTISKNQIKSYEKNTSIINNLFTFFFFAEMIFASEYVTRVDFIHSVICL